MGTAALDLLRIAAGIPRYGADIRERDLPQETEQERALNFSKGCYVGQEIVERIRSRGQVRRKFTGFEVNGPLPAAGKQDPGGWQRRRRDHQRRFPAPSREANAGWRWAISAAKPRRPGGKSRRVGAPPPWQPAVCGSIQVIQGKNLCLKKSRRALP